MGFGRVVQGLRPRSRGGGRRSPGPTAFVLSGGGVLGAVQVGQVEALLEAGVVPDLLVGTSVGALNAAAVAADPTPEGVRRLRSLWTELRTPDLFPGSRLHRAMQIIRRGDHLYPNDGIRRLIDLIPARSFTELARPLAVGATNLKSGREHWFSSGAIAPALLASTALPGIFPPVSVEGDVFVDGGVVNNVPISRAVEMGAKRIFLLTCGGAKPMPRPIRGPLDVLLQAVSHMRIAAVDVEVARYASTAAITVLPTFDPGAVRFTDPSRSVELMDRAAALTRGFLAGAPAPEPSVGGAVATANA